MVRVLVSTVLMFLSGFAAAACPEILNFEARKLRSSESINFCEAYADKVVLVVNTASQCGYTPQFKQLESLYQSYKDDGLVIVGFPSNDFRQEFSDEDKVADVCYVNYGVSFPMVATSSVKGAKANVLFQRLSAATGEAPQWNFNKYLIGPDGKPVLHFPSRIQPMGGALEAKIREML